MLLNKRNAMGAAAHANIDDSGDENLTDCDFIDNPQSIIDMAFDPKASLKPTQSVIAASGRPRKPNSDADPISVKKGSNRLHKGLSSVHKQQSMNFSNRSPMPFNFNDDLSQSTIPGGHLHLYKSRSLPYDQALHKARVGEDLEDNELDTIDEETPSKRAPIDGLTLRNLTARRTRNQSGIMNAQTVELPRIQTSLVENQKRNSPIQANFEERLMQASRVFLMAKSDGKKVQLFQHSDSLYHPVKPVNDFQDGFRDLTFLVQSDPLIATMVLNQASKQIIQLQQSQRNPLLEIQLHRFIQNLVSHMFCGLNPQSMDKSRAMLKAFTAQPVLLTATIETEELRGKITQDQYTLVLEDLFIGMTKNCPESINFLPQLFKKPMEKLQASYFGLFNLNDSSDQEVARAQNPEEYLDTAQTPDKILSVGTKASSDQNRPQHRNTIQRSIPVKNESIRTRNGQTKPGTMESVSCGLLKLLCLTPDLETGKGANAADLDKLEEQELWNEQGGYEFADAARKVQRQAGAFGKASGQQSNRHNTSFSQNSSASRKPLAYLDRILKEWSSDPAVPGRDNLYPGSSLEDLNQIFALREDELPSSNTLPVGQIQNVTQMTIRFAEEIVQNIINSIHKVPTAIRTFLIDIIANTKEGDASVLTLADTFVLTGFFIQKWITFGFRWCIQNLKQQLKHNLSGAKGMQLIEIMRVAQQLVFCIFTFNKIELAAPGTPTDFDLGELNEFIKRQANQVPNLYRTLLKKTQTSDQELQLPVAEGSKPFNMTLLKLSDLQWLVRICRSIATLQELTPRSRQYVGCTQLLRIIDNLNKPYQSVLTGVSLEPEQTAQTARQLSFSNATDNYGKKMIQEASLAEQIETQGYHLKDAQNTTGSTPAAIQQQNDSFKSGRSLSRSRSRTRATPNLANNQYIMFVNSKFDGLSQPQQLAERTKMLDQLEQQTKLLLI